MKIKFINHACFIVESEGQRIMCDPWFEGSAFDNGWSLMYEEIVPDPEDYDSVWVSHEHPDHFRPSLFNGSSIPTDKSIVLQDRPKDKKLCEWFDRKGYQVYEIPPGLELEVNQSLSLSGDLNYDFDSWVCFKSPDITILNLNDCINFKTDEEILEIKNKIGHVDVLMTQFSFANWTGNKGDAKTPQKAKDIVLGNLKRIFEIMDPASIIPFASFVCFSHEENAYLNDNSIHIKQFIDTFPEHNVVAMKPGDEWTVAEPWESNQEAVEFWEACANSIEDRKLTKTRTYSFDSLRVAYRGMIKRMKSVNDMKYLADVATELQPAHIYIDDLGISVSFNIFKKDLTHAYVSEKDCDVKMTSESLLNVIKNPWGFGTLMVNGRFQANYQTFRNFVSQTRLYYMNNIGKTFPESVTVTDIMNSSSLVHRLVSDTM